MLHALAPNRETGQEASPQSGRRLRRGLGAGLLVFTLGAASALPAWARDMPGSFADLAETVSPAVVNISVKHPGRVAQQGPMGQGMPDGPFRDFLERFFGDQMPHGMPQGAPQGRQQQQDYREGPPPEMTAVGSGFIIDSEGYVVTNNHVVSEANEITVTLKDGIDYEAELIGTDDRTDLALLKVDTEGKSLPQVSWGDSDEMRVGDWVMAVGNPFGLGGTVTAGIISARGRDLPGGTLIDYLQIDAPINRGNSGGPTFDMDGNVIGVNTAIYSPNGGSVGIGFAIPANLAKAVVDDLREKGHVDRGWLGVQIQGVTPELAEGLGLDEPRGALVAAVTPDSPASRSALQAGDVILSWDGEPVAELKDLPKLVANTEAGASVEMEVWRDRDTITVAVETGSMPSQDQLAANDNRGGATAPTGGEGVDLAGTGLVLGDLSPEERRRYGIPEGSDGPVVVEVQPDSAAAEQGLRQGDVIASLSMKPVKNASEAREVLEQVREQGDKVVTLQVNRGENSRFVALRLGA